MNPLSMNKYAYVENNPINYIDPSGHMAVWLLNSISKAYNNNVFSDWDASLAILSGNLISNGKHPSLFTPFHEIAQINVAKHLYKITRQDVVLEKSIGTGEYYKVFGIWKREKKYEADIVMGKEVWEVKPINGRDPKKQLELYRQKGGLVPSKRLLGQTITGITVFDELKMKITFPQAGEAIYELYLDKGNGTKEILTTVAAAKLLLKMLLTRSPKLIRG